MSSITIARAIDLARARHPAFSQADADEGALVIFADATQRTLLLRYGSHVDGLYSTSAEIATRVAGALVGVDSDGVPFVTSTVEDGFAIHEDENGVPYFDTTELPIAGDPFGENGGTPGFTLPTDFVKLIGVVSVLGDRRLMPIDIVPEPRRLDRTRIGVPTAFLSGNRIVPIRPLASGNWGDPWSANIVALQLSYIAWPPLTALTDAITLPAVLLEALIAAMASYLAQLAPGLTVAQRVQWQQQAERAADLVENLVTDVTGPVTTDRVAFRR